ncbi:hypothetical protein N5D52_14905 [Pseudomonas sp. GD03860]|uniref:hypothetical protein n=1 Tax=Pseudomonas TaxID=286 RepID=UPI00236341FB|nr:MULTISPECIES: hypothetical protein [Pseudomonas]MDD2056570.1 hypothetical protein [Pseudomonas putida]MDH0638235.1 hypothetical protein [Pseudomonas sp. GD03860]
MAASQQDRSAKAASKRKAVGEEELRMRARQGTRNVLAELMEWHGIEEQGEAMTLALHHLHAMGPEGSRPFFTPPRHEITVSPIVARRLELAYQRQALRICHDE